MVLAVIASAAVLVMAIKNESEAKMNTYLLVHGQDGPTYVKAQGDGPDLIDADYLGARLLFGGWQHVVGEKPATIAFRLGKVLCAKCGRQLVSETCDGACADEIADAEARAESDRVLLEARERLEAKEKTK
jgi:hypothetical protein